MTLVVFNNFGGPNKGIVMEIGYHAMMKSGNEIMRKKTSFLQNPVIYGILGFMLVAAPSLYFFFAGFPMTGVSETVTQTEIGINRTIVTETVRIGAFNPYLLIFVIGVAVAAWGCYRSTPMAWIGSLFVLTYSILAMFSIGMLILPGALLLLTGAVFKTIKARTIMPAIYTF